MSSSLTFITADWPAPARVRVASTTRNGGVSVGPYRSFNLGDHVGDDPAAVAANRQQLVEALQLPAMPHWLRQVHGISVAALRSAPPKPDADAAWTDVAGQTCAILTADCLPVLFCDTGGSVVAAAHAGWRGLAGGIIAACARALPVPPQRLIAWLGPAISQAAFEVGEEVRRVFVTADPRTAGAFAGAGAPGKYRADLYAIARLQLETLGVSAVYGGGLCTHADAVRFYSYRRDGECGRMASLIWLED